MYFRSLLKFVVGIIILSQLIFAASPNNVLAARTELVDGKGDWSEFNVNIDFTGYNYRITLQTGNESICEEQNFPRKDITSANYLQDDNYLNGTIWLEDALQKIPPDSLKGVIYTMSIVDLSTKPNPIYTVANSWDPEHKWLRTVYEHSLSNATRLVESSTKSVGFGNTTVIPGQVTPKSYVDFSLNIRKLVLPDNFFVVFSVVEFTDKCFVLDTIDQTLSAERVLNASSTPEIELRPGEDKNVELTLRSSLELGNVTIGAENRKEVSVNFLSDKVSFDMSGNAFPVSTLKISPDAVPREYSIPYFVNISLPETTIYPVLFTNIGVEKGLHTSVMLVDYLKVSVLPAYTEVEKLNLIFQGNAGILSVVALILSGVLGGFSIFYAKTKK